MEAAQPLVISQGEEEQTLLTLQELLAGVLLEKGFMDDRTGKIINHEFENWFNLLLGISRIVR